MKSQPRSYKLVDSGDFLKLEQVGPYTVVRPCPQAVWNPRLSASVWKKLDARYERFSGGQGKWHVFNKDMPKEWEVEIDSVLFKARLTDFGHLGFFVEHARRWAAIRDSLKSSQEPKRVLNLFGYTGAATIACLQGGAEVVHVDASKASVAWARENADLNDVSSRPVRWIVEDAQKFVSREVRRGNKYDGIILDPPSYGRGAKGEVWKIESDLPRLLESVFSLLEKDSFVLLSSHSNGYTPQALENLFHGQLKDFPRLAGEMLISEGDGERSVPSGAFALIGSIN